MAGAVQTGTLEDAFYAGRYQEVLDRCLPHAEHSTRSWVVGALALTGRLDEARALAASIADAGDVDESVAANFFVCIGYCHAGRPRAAERYARRNLAWVRGNAPLRAFHAAQGLAMFRYFQGAMHKAETLARASMRAAVRANHRYGQLLSTELLGHVLVQQGRIFAGLQVLEHATDLAQKLGTPNAETIRVSRLAYEIGMRVGDVSANEKQLVAAVDSDTVSFFSRRSALCQLAWLYAMRGDAARATSMVERARVIALADGDFRGRVRTLVATALVRGLGAGPDAAQEYLDEALRLANDEVSLLVEIAFCEVITGAKQAAIASLRSLPARGVQRATLILQLADGAGRRSAPLEDGLFECLSSLTALTPGQVLERLAQNDLLGLLPGRLSRTPAKRVWVAPTCTILEHEGTVRRGELPSGPSRRLLEALADGPKSRAALLQLVWGIAAYRPDLHDPPLYTAVARLRGSLDPCGDWIVTTATGYGLAPELEVVDFTSGSMDSVDAVPVDATPPSAASAPTDDADRGERVRTFLARSGAESCGRVAEHLGVSKASALRLLQEMVAKGEVIRRGRGKATSYLLP
ncbi:MAG: hypothetical protein KC417_02275 [Myxococcales bacterium]|nr:hypothetical protein [Myxococcales bacterium]